MSPRVKIVTERPGWILHRIARAIADRLDYVRINPRWGRFDVVYFMPNYEFRKVAGAKTTALFTHREDGVVAKERVWDHCVANVDCCLALSPRYRDLLLSQGAKRVEYIAPGLDLDLFTPRLRVGFIGRRYHSTGRKGEALLDRVAELDFVDLRRTGGKLSARRMPDFYRGLDVVLITSLREGLPMCLLEGLATGVPVVTTDVGMVREFSEGVTIFDGTFGALEAILRARFEERLALRRQVEHLTWDALADAYDRLFRNLAA